MTAHARQQIRDFVATKLLDLPTTRDQVFVGRARSLPAGHSPALLIYVRGERIGRDAQGNPPPQLRVLKLDIIGRVSMADTPDDQLDEIAAEIEAAMWSAWPDMAVLNGVGVLSAELVEVDIMAKAEGEKHLGAVVLSYEVTYRTIEGSPRELY